VAPRQVVPTPPPVDLGVQGGSVRKRLGRPLGSKNKQQGPRECQCGARTASFALPGQRVARWCKSCPNRPTEAVKILVKRRPKNIDKVQSQNNDTLSHPSRTEVRPFPTLFPHSSTRISITV
jgi:hypothetical protein